MEALTYYSDDSLLVGQIVLVPIGKRKVPGVVIKKVAQPDFKTKTILKVLYSKPLPKHLLKTASFIHDYYLTPTGQAISLILPRGVEKQRRKPKTEQMFGNSAIEGGGLAIMCSVGYKDLARVARNVPEGHVVANLSPSLLDIPLNPAQKKALQALQKAPGATKLLFGVTGSGKTNIYLKMAAGALSEQKSVILLVPEIALTGQLVQVFKEYFENNVVLLHSRQTEAERH